MALVNVTRKPVSLQGYQLTSQTDMVTALTYLSSRGYSGSVNCYKQAGAATWQIMLQSDSGSGATPLGALNDWIIIENDTVATIVPAAKAALIYQVA